jgi:TPR repeat protein/serine/threonine protein kinase
MVEKKAIQSDIDWMKSKLKEKAPALPSPARDQMIVPSSPKQQQQRLSLPLRSQSKDGDVASLLSKTAALTSGESINHTSFSASFSSCVSSSSNNSDGTSHEEHETEADDDEDDEELSQIEDIASNQLRIMSSLEQQQSKVTEESLPQRPLSSSQQPQQQQPRPASTSRLTVVAPVVGNPRNSKRLSRNVKAEVDKFENAALFRRYKLPIKDVSVPVSGPSILLGKGKYSEVTLGFYQKNEKIAIKSISTSLLKNPIVIKRFENEFRIMKSLCCDSDRNKNSSSSIVENSKCHSTILGCFGYLPADHASAASSVLSIPVVEQLVLEYSPYGSLKDILSNTTAFDNIPVSLLVAWFSDIADALTFLHSKSIQHRNVKPSNLLLFPNLTLKLADFSLAHYTEEQQEETHQRVKRSVSEGGQVEDEGENTTKEFETEDVLCLLDSAKQTISPSSVENSSFLSPEVRVGQAYTFASDIFSFAMTCLTIITRKEPKINYFEKQVIEIISFLAIPDEEISKRLEECFLACVAYDSKAASSATQVRPAAYQVKEEIMEILSSLGGDPRDEDSNDEEVCLKIKDFEEKLQCFQKEKGKAVASDYHHQQSQPLHQHADEEKRNRRLIVNKQPMKQQQVQVDSSNTDGEAGVLASLFIQDDEITHIHYPSTAFTKQTATAKYPASYYLPSPSDCNSSSKENSVVSTLSSSLAIISESTGGKPVTTNSPLKCISLDQYDDIVYGYQDKGKNNLFQHEEGKERAGSPESSASTIETSASFLENERPFGKVVPLNSKSVFSTNKNPARVSSQAMTFRSSFDHHNTSISSGIASLTSVPSVDETASLVDNSDYEEINAFCSYFSDSFGLSSTDCVEIATILVRNGVLNAGILQRRIQRNPSFLFDFGLDEEICQLFIDHFSQLPPIASSRSSSAGSVAASLTPSMFSRFGVSTRRHSLISQNEMNRRMSGMWQPHQPIQIQQQFQQFPTSSSSSVVNSIPYFDIPNTLPSELSRLYCEVVQNCNEKSFQALQRYAYSNDESSNPLAECFLMRLYAVGQGIIRKDTSKAKEMAYYLFPWLQEVYTRSNPSDVCLPFVKFFIGVCYNEGLEVSLDTMEALRWYKMAADEHNYQLAQAFLGTCYLFGTNGCKQDYFEALHYFTLASEANYANAQCNLGLMYEEGLGCEKNLAMALYWYERSAEQGDAAGLFNLGYFYEKRIGFFPALDNDLREEKVFFYYSESSAKDYMKGQYHLALCYYSGLGCEQDFQLAFQLFEKTARKGYLAAQCRLGNCYQNALGCQRNQEKAFYWYRKAVTDHSSTSSKNIPYLSEAYNQLGYCFFNGCGIEQNLSEAIHYYEIAASFGYHAALNTLGFFRFNGIGLQQDFEIAVRYYKESADLGYAPAQYNLGFCYENGYGVSRKINAVLKYYRLASSQGHEKASKALSKLELRY